MKNNGQAARNRLSIRRNNSESSTSRRSENIYARLRRILFKPKLFALPLLALAFGAFAGNTQAEDYIIGSGDIVTASLDNGNIVYKDGNGNLIDLSSKLILDGGIFNDEIEKGISFTTNGWGWGENGGTINVSQGKLSIPNTINLDNIGATLTKDGANDLHISNNGTTNALSNITIKNGLLNINGKLILGAGSNEEQHSSIRLAKNSVLSNHGWLQVSDLQESDVELPPLPDYLENNNGVQIAKDSVVDLYSEATTLDELAGITTHGNFNSEGTINLTGGVFAINTLHYTDFKDDRELNIDIANVTIDASGDKDIEGAYKELNILNKTSGNINLNGNINIKGAGSIPEDGTDEDVKMKLVVGHTEPEGEIYIKGIFKNENGGNAIFNNHVTITGEYYSNSIDNRYNKDTYDHYGLNVFHKGASFSGATFVATDALFGGDVEITNGSNVVFQCGSGVAEDRTEGDEIVDNKIIINTEGTLYANTTNILTNVDFGNDSTGRLVLGNYDLLTTGTVTEPLAYTTDEYGQATYLKMNNTRSLLSVLLNGVSPTTHLGFVFGSSITGKGTVEINTPTGYSVNDHDYRSYLALMAGDKTGFTGNTEVKRGGLVLYCCPEVENAINRSSFQWGSETKEGIFNVYGEKVVNSDDPNDKVTTDGQLIFWRPNKDAYSKIDANGQAHFTSDKATLDDAPILYADTVNFLAGAATGDIDDEHGAKIMFNTTFLKHVLDDNGNPVVVDNDGKLNTIVEADNTSDRNLGTINANKVNFSKSNYIWYDAVSSLTDEATMKITLNAPEITVADENGVHTIDDENKALLEDIFNKPLIETKATQISDQQGYTIENNVKNIANFANEENMSTDEINYAGQIDTNRIKLSNAGIYDFFYDSIYNSNSTDDVRQTIHNLARSFGLENMAHSTMQLGMAGSSFFSGLTAGGAVTRNQDGWNNNSIDPLSNKSAISDVNQQQNATASYARNSAFQKRSLWGTFAHTSLDADQYEQGGITYDAYKVRRDGFLGGLKRQFDDTTSGGILFAYSGPELNQHGNYDGWNSGYNTEMDMDDFQFALHLEKVIGDAWEVCLFAGGGAQSLDWDRTVTEGNNYYNFTGDTTGNTVTATAYLARRIDLTDHWVIRPTVGVDSEHSWLFGFDEVANNNNSTELDNKQMAAATQAYHYDEIQFSRNTGRVGMTTTWSGPAERGGITGRAFYGVQLGGDDAASVTMQSLKGGNLDWSSTSVGHNMGQESLTLGMGGYLFLNQAKTITLNGDYNAIMYKNATTQNASGSVSYQF